MRFTSLLTYAFGIYSVMGQSRGQVSRSSALAVLHAVQRLQTSIHADTLLVDSIISQAAAAPSPGANKTATMDAVGSVLNRMISSIENTTAAGASNKLVDRGIDLERRDIISDIVFGLVGAVQAIVADLGSVIGAVLNFFNRSETVMTLIAVLIQAVLGLVNGILVPLVTSPFGEPLRQLIISILKLVPV